MSVEELQKQLTILQRTVDAQERKLQDFEKLKAQFRSHRHLGRDGSSTLVGDTETNHSNINILAGQLRDGISVDPSITISDNTQNVSNIRRRKSAYAMVVLNKGETNELIRTELASGVSGDNTKPSTDFVSGPGSNQSEVTLEHNPLVMLGSTAVNSDTSSFYGNSTPLFNSPVNDGAIVNGGSVLTSTVGGFIPGQLVGSVIQFAAEGHFITANTTNTITASDTFFAATGSYTWFMHKPLYLGNTTFQWRKFFVLGNEFLPGKFDPIQFGFGSTTGSHKIKIMYGIGDPTNVVVATVGSLYLRTDGGTNTTLYVKETGGNTSSGWVAK